MVAVATGAGLGMGEGEAEAVAKYSERWLGFGEVGEVGEGESMEEASVSVSGEDASLVCEPSLGLAEVSDDCDPEEG
jgi:hypothetical protein